MAAKIVTNKVILFEILINLDTKDIATMSLLNKSIYQKIRLILQTKMFWTAKLGYDVDQILSQANPGDFTYDKWIRLMGNQKLSYSQALFQLSDGYRFIPEIFDIRPDSNRAEILLHEAAKFGHPRATFEVTAAPLWGLYGEHGTDVSLAKLFYTTLMKVKELAETGNRDASEFVEMIDEMSEEELSQFFNGD